MYTWLTVYEISMYVKYWGKHIEYWFGFQTFPHERYSIKRMKQESGHSFAILARSRKWKLLPHVGSKPCCEVNHFSGENVRNTRSYTDFILIMNACIHEIEITTDFEKKVLNMYVVAFCAKRDLKLRHLWRCFLLDRKWFLHSIKDKSEIYWEIICFSAAMSWFLWAGCRSFSLEIKSNRYLQSCLQKRLTVKRKLISLIVPLSYSYLLFATWQERTIYGW